MKWCPPDHPVQMKMCEIQNDICEHIKTADTGQWDTDLLDAMDNFSCVNLQNVDSWSTCAKNVLFILTDLDGDKQDVKRLVKTTCV